MQHSIHHSSLDLEPFYQLQNQLRDQTIGCAKKRLTGSYDKSQLSEERGATLPLILNNEIIGNALRTQVDTKPVFVSIGHKIDLITANQWILKLAHQYRLPETTRQADQLVNEVRKKL